MYLMLILSLPWENWPRLGIWLAIGFAIYFACSRPHIHLARYLAHEISRHGVSPGGSSATDTEALCDSGTATIENPSEAPADKDKQDEPFAWKRDVLDVLPALRYRSPLEECDNGVFGWACPAGVAPTNLNNSVGQ